MFVKGIIQIINNGNVGVNGHFAFLNSLKLKLNIIIFYFHLSIQLFVVVINMQAVPFVSLTLSRYRQSLTESKYNMKNNVDDDDNGDKNYENNVDE